MTRTTAAILLALATTFGVVAQTTTSTDKGPATQTNTLQVTGTVISSDGSRLIVKGDNGQQMTFIITDETAEPRLFHPGDRVTASYVTLAGTGPVVTKVIEIPAAQTATSTATVIYPPAAPAPTATATVTVPAPAPAATATATVTTPAPAPVTTTTDDDDQMAATLPATASPLPIVALFGLFAAGGAGAIRRFRKS